MRSASEVTHQHTPLCMLWEIHLRHMDSLGHRSTQSQRIALAAEILGTKHRMYHHQQVVEGEAVGCGEWGRAEWAALVPPPLKPSGTWGRRHGSGAGRGCRAVRKPGDGGGPF